ncbi:MAG: hypothetical protein AB3N06_07535 [Erythrobacter sp.]
MIDLLALAAEAMDGYEPQGLDPHLYTLVSVVGWFLLHALLPLIGGIAYASHWRRFLLWIAALAVASFAMQVGQELWSVASYNDYGTVSGALSQIALFVFAPAFGGAAIGIFIRRMWDHSMANKATAGAQQ